MKPAVKLFLKIFFASTIIYAAVITVFDSADGEIEWKYTLLNALLFGVLFSMVMVLLQIWAAKKKGKKLGDKVLSVKQEETIKLALSQQQIFEKLDAETSRQKWLIRQDEKRIEIATKKTWKSWGELITISINDGEDGQNTVRIKSEPKVETTMIDYGKNRQNIELIKEVLL